MKTMRRYFVTLTAMLSFAAMAPVRSSPVESHPDWPMFGWDVGRSSAPGLAMGVAETDLKALQRQQVVLDGTVDASAIYLHGARVRGAAHDVFFVTTTYGKTLAIDADNGTLLWEFTPTSYADVKDTYRITTSTPVTDPDRTAIYAASPDGSIRRLDVADGRVEWSTSITRLPEREKIASPLGFFQGRVIAATGGYIGDRPPYQGHVVMLDAATGKVLHVWNALCSNRRELQDPKSCPESGAAIWGRGGAVIDAKTGNMFIATGNAKWNGIEHWGDAVIELDPDATKILGNFTPTDTEQLDEEDLDIGSSAPALTGGSSIVQGGKDGWLRVLNWRRMAGVVPHRGSESSRVRPPGGARVFTAPAVSHVAGSTWIYVADDNGTQAWTLSGYTLQAQWHNDHAGTSPVIVDGLAYVYDPNGGLRVYEAASGRELAELACGGGHWNSPIVADGRIALPEGNANAHKTSGVFDIWRVAKH